VGKSYSYIHSNEFRFVSTSLTDLFLKNPAWHGEKRNKAVGDAYIDEPIQDLVLIASWTLSVLVHHVESLFTSLEAQRAIEALEDEVRRGKELRRRSAAFTRPDELQEVLRRGFVYFLSSARLWESKLFHIVLPEKPGRGR